MASSFSVRINIKFVAFFWIRGSRVKELVRLSFLLMNLRNTTFAPPPLYLSS